MRSTDITWVILYNTVYFACAAWAAEAKQDNVKPPTKRAKTQGEVQPHQCGVPAIAKQELPKGKAAQQNTKGTPKLAILKEDPSSEKLLIGSCIDRKRFYMLLMTAERMWGAAS